VYPWGAIFKDIGPFQNSTLKMPSIRKNVAISTSKAPISAIETVFFSFDPLVHSRESSYLSQKSIKDHLFEDPELLALHSKLSIASSGSKRSADYGSASTAQLCKKFSGQKSNTVPSVTLFQNSRCFIFLENQTITISSWMDFHFDFCSLYG